MSTQELTKQAVFDSVVRALAAQGGPSLDNENSCVYRGPGGRKCAAGIVIADDEYDVVMEGKRVSSFVLPDRFDPVMTLLADLQHAHDYATFNGVNGTAEWRDPQGDGGKPVATRSDIWSAGHSDVVGRRGIAHLLRAVGRWNQLDVSAVDACWPPAAV